MDKNRKILSVCLGDWVSAKAEKTEFRHMKIKKPEVHFIIKNIVDRKWI